MGVFINVVAIIIGGLLGILFKRFINEDISKRILKYLGVVVIVLALSWAISKTIIIKDGNLTTNGELLLIVSIVLGAIIGEIFKIDDRLNNLSSKLENKYKIMGFMSGFLAATLLFGVGAMTVVGPIEEALLGNNNILLVKSGLDFISSIILGSTLGYGVIFSSIPIFIVEITFYLLAPYLSISTEMLNDILLVGYVIIFTIGINLSGLGKIKTGNLLPSMLIPIIYHLILNLL